MGTTMAFDHDDGEGPQRADGSDDDVTILRALMRTMAVARKLAQDLSNVDAESLADLEATIGATELAILRLGEETAEPGH